MTVESSAAATGVPRWTRLAAFLVMASAGPLLMFVAALIFGLDAGDAPFFLVPAAIQAMPGNLGSQRRRARTRATWRRELSSRSGCVGSTHGNRARAMLTTQA